MKTYIYAWYDKQIGAFSQPFTTNFDKEMTKESLIREMKLGKIPKEVNNKDLYFLAYFHDDEGLLELTPKEYVITITESEKKE